MTIIREFKEPKPTLFMKVKAWSIVVFCVLCFSWIYGVGMNGLMLKACAGEYNTQQCKKDKEKEKAYKYAEEKRESIK